MHKFLRAVGFSKIKDQGNQGSCLAFALTSICEYFFNSTNNNINTDLSEAFLYYCARAKGNKQNEDSGSRIDYSLEALAEFGICREELFKYDDNIVDGFMQLLDTKIHEAKDMLIERFEWVCSQSFESAKFMYENNTMAGYVPEEGIRSALKHGTLVIGQIGLAETLQILIGKNHLSEEGMDVAKRIFKLFRRKCNDFKEEYKLNFGVYNTPKLLWAA